MPIINISKTQRGFHLVEVLLVVLVLGLIGFLGYRVYQATSNSNNPPSADSRGPNYKALPNCGNGPILTTAPADISLLDKIGVLGGVDPPDHTLPNDHTYLGYTYGSTEQREIYAPADMVVTGIGFGGEYENGALINADYSIDAYPCRELGLRFGHMDVLSDKLKAALGQDYEKDDTGCTISKQEYKEIKSCGKAVDLKVSAGELLATTNGWDLWATMEGFVSPNVTSPEYYHNVDAVCPFEYFTDELKAQFYAKSDRDGEPKCGEAYQDKANTLQGGWFAHKDPTQAKTDWSSHFSLTHNTSETKIGQVGVSGKLTGTDFTYRFIPKHSGTINREPSETSAGIIYCYEHEGDRRFRNGDIAGTGKILLELIDNHTMLIEYKNSACTANESFSNPTTYYR